MPDPETWDGPGIDIMIPPQLTLDSAGPEIVRLKKVYTREPITKKWWWMDEAGALFEGGSEYPRDRHE